MLQYLHENGCPWDEGTCYYAAKEGHVDVLRYAHEKGCPWNPTPTTCYMAAQGGHLDGVWGSLGCSVASLGRFGVLI